MHPYQTRLATKSIGSTHSIQQISTERATIMSSEQTSTTTSSSGVTAPVDEQQAAQNRDQILRDRQHQLQIEEQEEQKQSENATIQYITSKGVSQGVAETTAHFIRRGLAEIRNREAAATAAAIVNQSSSRSLEPIIPSQIQQTTQPTSTPISQTTIPTILAPDIVQISQDELNLLRTSARLHLQTQLAQVQSPPSARAGAAGSQSQAAINEQLLQPEGKYPFVRVDSLAKQLRPDMNELTHFKAGSFNQWELQLRTVLASNGINWCITSPPDLTESVNNMQIRSMIGGYIQQTVKIERIQSLFQQEFVGGKPVESYTAFRIVKEAAEAGISVVAPQLRIQIQTLKQQPGESVRRYQLRFNHIRDQLLIAKMQPTEIDNLIRDAFTQGINNTLDQALTTYINSPAFKTDSIETIFTKAFEAEQHAILRGTIHLNKSQFGDGASSFAVQSLELSTPTQNVKEAKCFKCGRKGHLKKDCRTKPQNYSPSKKKNSNNNSNNSNNSNNNSRRSFNNSNPPTFDSSIPNANSPCTLKTKDGKPHTGHLAGNCIVQQYQKRKKQTNSNSQSSTTSTSSQNSNSVPSNSNDSANPLDWTINERKTALNTISTNIIEVASAEEEKHSSDERLVQVMYDTGAAKTIIPMSVELLDAVDSPGTFLKMANGAELDKCRSGTAKINLGKGKYLTLEVIQSPHVSRVIVSGRQMHTYPNVHHTLCFPNDIFFCDANNKVLFHAVHRNKLYFFINKPDSQRRHDQLCFLKSNIERIIDESSTSNSVQVGAVTGGTTEIVVPNQQELREILTEHQRLGHISTASLQQLLKLTAVTGFNEKIMAQMKSVKDLIRCKGCAEGKMHRKAFGQKMFRNVKKPLDLLVIDSAGPISESHEGCKYFHIIVDVFSGYIWTFCTIDKSQTAEQIIMVLKQIHIDRGKHARIILADGAKEFFGIAKYCEDVGTKFVTRVPYTPQHTATAERGIRTIMDIAAPMLHQADLPALFWTDAVIQATVIANKLRLRPTGTDSNSKLATPYEIMHEKLPDVKHLHVFGCDCDVLYTQQPGSKLPKFEKKSRLCMYVGYYEDKPGYKFFDPETNTFGYSREIKFYDQQFTVAASIMQAHRLETGDISDIKYFEGITFRNET